MGLRARKAADSGVGIVGTSLEESWFTGMVIRLRGSYTVRYSTYKLICARLDETIDCSSPCQGVLGREAPEELGYPAKF